MAVKKSPKKITKKIAKPATKKAPPAPRTRGGSRRSITKKDLVATVIHLQKWLRMLELLVNRLPDDVQLTPKAAEYALIDKVITATPPVYAPICEKD